jgi:hypothetical protein
MDNKKIYVVGGLIILVCVLIGGYFLERSRPATPIATVSKQTSTANFDPLNATYILDGSPVTLIGGKSTQVAAPGSAEVITTELFGEPMLGDVNGNGVNDAAVMLVQTGSGSGTFYYVAAALATSSGAGGTVGTNTIFLGDRIAPDTMQIANGIIMVNYADRKPTDPMTTAPSVGVSKYLVVVGTTLYDTPSDIYPLPSGIAWNAAHAATVLPGDENVPAPLAGIKITSQPITNITDLSALSTPFENYYKKKLAAAGWTVDSSLAAGGPGAEIDGYKKGNDYIILQFTSVFKNNGGGNSPETCPCDLAFSIFAGTVE